MAKKKTDKNAAKKAAAQKFPLSTPSEHDFDDEEWVESVEAILSVDFGQAVFWLDSLLDVAVDIKSTPAQRRAAEIAYDAALLAHRAFWSLRETLDGEGTETLNKIKARLLVDEVLGHGGDEE